MSTLQPSLTPVQNAARQDRRAARYISRRFLHFNSSITRLRFCGVDPVQTKGNLLGSTDSSGRFNGAEGHGGHVTVKATGTGPDRRAGYGSLQLCGSVWSCPVCSAKINTVRAADIGAAVSSWHAPVFGPQPKSGPLPRGRVVFLTLTMRHRRGQELDDLWTRGVSAGWHASTAGSGWVADQADYGVWVPRTVKSGKDKGKVKWGFRIGYARVVETTHGKNGWHVHVHALLFVRGDMTVKEAFALGDSMFSRWSASLVAAGFTAPTLENGVDVRLIGPTDSTKVAEYFAKNTFAGQGNANKAGWEAAGGTGKSGRAANRTPFQILEDLCSGEDYPTYMKDLGRWWVWEKASKGKRQLTWSPWLRAELALADELTDDEIAASELGGSVVLRLRPEQFDAVVTAGAHQLLTAVEADDTMAAAYLWLDTHLGIWRTRTDFALVGEEWTEVTIRERVN